VSARVDARNGWLVCSAAIDNLGKGAAGQALQNANVALGLDERTGLDHVGVWP
jgi:N-acetyl-gamma-glutamyl-phosphate reductase